MSIRIDFAFGALALAASAYLASTAVAGGIERFCVNGTGPQVTERWTNPVAVPWALGSGPGSNYAAPGYPPMLCPAIGALPDAQKPGLQSIYNAIATWNNAALPFGPAVSGFSFATPASAPRRPYIFNTGLGDYTPHAWWNFNGPGFDGVNEITMWDNAGTFTAALGGPVALAITLVDAPGGVINEVDVALPGRWASVGTVADWSFVENNTALGITLASKTAFAPGTPFSDPTFGYADLQGVLVHELGHFAGLGHSLIDAIHVGSTSTFPTMFAEAQNEAFSATVSFPGVACTFNTQATNAPGTVFQGMLGRSAATLELDDLFAIAEGYPLPAGSAYWVQSGSIAGVVTNAGGTPVRGVAVMAIDPTQPDVVRVGTLTYAGGAYAITGLKPGSYMVKIELVDRGPAPAYFREFDVPNFVQSPANWGCVNPLPTPASEWFDAAEAATEASNANATAITVTAGATTTANLVINSLPNQLFVSATGSLAQSSPRGVRVPATAGTNVDFFVTGVPPGGFATVFFDLAHTTIPFGAQIAEVNPVAVFSTTANGAGVAQFTIPITPGLARGNFLGQAAFIDAAGNVQLTNSLNMWVTGP